MVQPVRDMEPQGIIVPSHVPRHEPSEVGIRGIFLFGMVLLAVVVGVMLLLSSVMRGYVADERGKEASRPALFTDDRGQFPTPRLQSNPAAELAELRREEEALLSGYGWVDREKGVARIPIERAMEILARKGLPARKTGGEASRKGD